MPEYGFSLPCIPPYKNNRIEDYVLKREYTDHENPYFGKFYASYSKHFCLLFFTSFSFFFFKLTNFRIFPSLWFLTSYEMTSASVYHQVSKENNKSGGRTLTALLNLTRYILGVYILICLTFSDGISFTSIQKNF